MPRDVLEVLIGAQEREAVPEALRVNLAKNLQPDGVAPVLGFWLSTGSDRRGSRWNRS